MLHILLNLLLATAPAACEITAAERTILLEQDWHTFDQSAEGFRTLVSAERYCPRLAGEVIEEYLAAHPELDGKERYVSEFHAGQQFAGANDVPRALSHFYRGFNPDEDPRGAGKWNAYVRATIAFLEHDRDTLEASFRVLEKHSGNRMNAINLRLVRAFVANFGKTYDEAVQAAFDE